MQHVIGGAVDGDRLVGDLKAVAHRAEADAAGIDMRLHVVDLGQVVDDTGRQDHAARGEVSSLGGRDKQAVLAAAKIGDHAVLDLRAIAVACSLSRVRISTPEMPSGKPGKLWLRGISAARLLPASMSRVRRRKRAR